MAHINQEKKKAIALELKPILQKYNVKATLSIEHHSTLHLNVSESAIDFFSNYAENRRNGSHNAFDDINEERKNMSINPYWYFELFTGVALEFLKEAMAVMNNGNHDRSDSQSDYFDVGWYVDINIGRWNKPYILNNNLKQAS